MKTKTWRASELENRLAAEIGRALREANEDAQLSIVPSSELAMAVERLIPEVLREEYPLWKGESLDAVFVSRALKTGENSLELVGSCILITDQSLTPLYAAFEVRPSLEAIASFDIRIGEPGGGPLGISGPPCNSRQAGRFQEHVLVRFELRKIEWVYTRSG